MAGAITCDRAPVADGWRRTLLIVTEDVELPDDLLRLCGHEGV